MPAETPQDAAARAAREIFIEVKENCPCGGINDPCHLSGCKPYELARRALRLAALAAKVEVAEGMEFALLGLENQLAVARREGAVEVLRALSTRCRQEEMDAVTLAFIETVDLDRLLRDYRSLPLSDKATEEKGGEHDSRG